MSLLSGPDAMDILLQRQLPNWGPLAVGPWLPQQTYGQDIGYGQDFQSMPSPSDEPAQPYTAPSETFAPSDDFYTGQSTSDLSQQGPYSGAPLLTPSPQGSIEQYEGQLVPGLKALNNPIGDDTYDTGQDNPFNQQPELPADQYQQLEEPETYEAVPEVDGGPGETSSFNKDEWDQLMARMLGPQGGSNFGGGGGFGGGFG